MALSGFQQDPYGPPGAGYFHGDSGPPVYAFHPELANQLSQGGPVAPAPIQPSAELQQAAAPGPDMRTAGLGGFGSTDQRLAVGGAAPGLDKQLGQMPDFGGAPAPGQGPAVGGGPRVPGEGGPQNIGQAAAQLNDQQLAQAMLKEQNARPTTTKAHYRPTSKEITVSDQGAPEAEENRALREDAYYGVLAATQNQGDLESQHLAQLATLNADQAAKQQAQINFQAKTQQATSELVAKDQTDLDRFQGELQQSQKDFNPNRLFSGAAGTMAGIGAAVFRAMGAYAAIRGHSGSNPAGEVIDSAIQRDIAQQKAEIEAKGSNANNALARLNKHYGNLEQATTALGILQNKYADTMALQLANSSGSQEVIAKTQGAIAAKQQAYATDNEKFNQLSYGKHAAKVAETYVAPSTSGGAPSVDKLLERGNKMATNEHTRAETDKLRADSGGKGEELVVPDGRGGTIKARTKEEAADLRTGYGDLITGQQAASKMIKTAQDTSSARGLNPITLEKERVWNSDREALMHSVNNALTGKSVAVREASMQRFEHALAGGPGSPGAAAAIEEIHNIITTSYQNKLDSQLSPGAKTPSITPKGATEYTGGE